MSNITILHWNTLATIYAKNDEKGFPFVNPEYLVWSHRSTLIKDTIISYNPDIFSCVEVDQFDFMKEVFGNDYYCLHFAKSNQGKEADGTAIFIRKSRFSLMPVEDKELLKVFKYGSTATQFALFIKVQDLVSNKILIYVATHLKAKPEFAAVREQQIDMLLPEIQKISQNDLYPVIIAGDFNDTPTSTIYSKLVDANFMDTHSGIKYTTHKTRKADHPTKRVIDYIWLKGLTLINFVLAYNHMDFEYPGLPNFVVPSDHLPLIVKVNF